MVENSSIVAVN